MKERGIGVAVAVLIIVIVAVAGAGAYIATRPQPDFQVENLSLFSDTVAKGEPVSASVNVANVGDAEGTHEVKLKLGGEVYATREVTLEAGESKTLSFEVKKQELGSYTLIIENLSKSFEVVEPAEFEVSNLSVSPKEAEVNERVTVMVDVKNVGGVEGTHNVKLRFSWGVDDTHEVTLNPNESTKVSFSFTVEEAGTYNPRIGNLSGSFKVLEPAEFEVSNLTVNPKEVQLGGWVEVSADVKNTGEISGSKMIEFDIGEKTKAKSVTLEAGENKTVSTSINAQEEGTTNVSVSGMSESFEVIIPQYPTVQIKLIGTDGLEFRGCYGGQGKEGRQAEEVREAKSGMFKDISGTQYVEGVVPKTYSFQPKRGVIDVYFQKCSNDSFGILEVRIIIDNEVVDHAVTTGKMGVVMASYSIPNDY